MFQQLVNLDRRWIFLAMALAVAVPILMDLRVKEAPTEMSQITFDVVDALPKGSRVLIAMDYDPPGKSELDPMASAIVRHAASKGHRLIFVSLWPTGPQFIDRVKRILQDEFPEYEYGTDYVDLGFKSGNEGVIKVIVSDIARSFPTDVAGRRLADLPLMRGVKNIRDVDLIVSISGGTPGAKEWIQYATTPYDIQTIAAVTGVQTPLFVAYYPGQLQGLLGSIKAAAEYETILLDAYPALAEAERGGTERDGMAKGNGVTEAGVTEAGVTVAKATEANGASTLNEAQRRMGPQLVAHLLMIGLIIAGNVAYFATRGRGAR